jgi:hypothetical protein
MFSGILAGRVRDWLVNHEVLSTFHAGFVRGKRTLDNVFIIKAIVVKYLREKRGRIYWCFVDFKKAFDSIDRETLWFKMRRIGVGENMANCIKIMYECTKFCMKCGENKVTTFAPQTRGVRQGCSLSQYLFNIFINDNMEYINVDNSNAPSIGQTIPGLLFADDLAVLSFTSNGLQKEIDQIVRYCKE